MVSTAHAQSVTSGNHLVTKGMMQLDTRVKGRVEPKALDGTPNLMDDAPKSWLHSWPGVYWHAVFNGSEVTLSFDDPADQYRLFIDGAEITIISKPSKQDYRISGLHNQLHDILLEKFSENQGAPTAFNGFFVPAGKGETAPHWNPSDRQIEFIGDSYTVGYGNTAGKRQCNKDEIWATTDTSKAFGPVTAEHFRADYQINAFSGRGMVRNYGGFIGDSLPALYPYTLYDGKTSYDAPDWNWKPQIIVIGLGTNDFTTPLHDGEKWKTREDLHADYEATYVKFVQSLRAQNPDAYFILMATDQVDGEIQSEAKKALAAIQATGETRITFLPMNGLNFGGCDYHPDTNDDRKVSDELVAWIDAHPEVWQGK
ncbi:SGNH/GDSL hydrolase family protein [Asticcacaulis sp.]|uniref:SGNH/GDSL hydrolase family protein n=1 Tax=Asticcacaulis sp. TaxID=1872648 RepID=UPI002C02CC2E|nr:GDSL-type esterase/lipase family protein [Asticcacaulis sp.]HTM82895.1 GDSL-type esterase/lipase family protein [Asticcacaulis sp.]